MRQKYLCSNTLLKKKIIYACFFKESPWYQTAMESFLKSIGKERHLDAFNKNEITLDLLKTLSRENLEKTLTLLNLNVGTFMSIIDAVETLKIKGK